MLRSALSIGTKATAAATAGIVGYGTYLYQTDEGTCRAIKAYSTFVPVVLHYRWMEAVHNYWDPQTEETWHGLDKIYAQPTVEKLGQLQGMYCKYGQTSAGFTNTFSDTWIKELRTLEDQVPPRSVETIYKTIEEETGKPVSETFSEFNPVPLGSASIGQVHKAKLKADGREVAVKVQYADSGRLFRKDIAAIRAFCSALAPEHIVTLDALEKQNAVELDYLQEAENLREIAANMKRHGFSPREVVVPKPISSLTTKRMLVMELLPGVKLIDGMRGYYAEWAKEHGTTLHELEKEARRKVEEEGIPAKYDGPSATQLEAYKRYLYLRDGIANVGVATYNSTLGWVPGRPLAYHETKVPPNTPRIIDTLMRVHGYQLLSDGVFNADPHGGNFLLLPDGRLGLIDYGATKRLTRKERLSSCMLYAALARNDSTTLFDMCDIGGYKSKYGKKEVLLKLLQFGFDSYGKDVTGGKNVQQFIDELKTEDPWEEVPDNLVMAQFMSIRLRSLALGMNHPVKVSEWLGPIAEEILKQEGLPYETWDHEQLVKYRPEPNIQKHKFA